MGVMIRGREMPSVYQSWDHAEERRQARSHRAGAKPLPILRLMRQNYGLGLLPLTPAQRRTQTQ